MGDVVITLPWLQDLRRQLGDAVQIDLLTRAGEDAIPRALRLFDTVYAASGGHSRIKLAAGMFRLLAPLRAQRYDMVIDLQRNRRTRLLRTLLQPRAWAQIERFSPTPAGEKYQMGIRASEGVPDSKPDFGLALRDPALGSDLLSAAGYDPARPLILLNPAGFFVTRNWPIERYAAFAQHWSQEVQAEAQYCIMGIGRLSAKAEALSAQIPGLINLVGKTSPAEAFAIASRAALVLSEDGGLMHMAWVSGTPTLALFGSSRHDWSGPQGPHSRCLHSGDLACGACLAATCMHGDVRCLTRYSPEYVVAQAKELLQALGRL